MNIKNYKNRLIIALGLLACVGATSAFADAQNDDEAVVTHNTLIDWSQKAQSALTRKLDQKLSLELMQNNTEIRYAKVLPPQYKSANLVLAGKPLGQSTVAPLSSIPVVIIVDEKKDCVINL